MTHFRPKTEDEMIADHVEYHRQNRDAFEGDNGRDALAETESSELRRFPDGRLWPDLVACPICGETTAISDLYQDPSGPPPSCGNCRTRFSGQYRLKLVDEATAKAADLSAFLSLTCPDCGAENLVSPEAVDPACQACGCLILPPKAKPLNRDELYEAAEEGRSTEWIASLVSDHGISELELFSVCEMVAYLADQGILPQVSMAYLREKLEVLTAYRRKALPNNRLGPGWDEAQKLAIPLRVGDFIAFDQEVWNVKSVDKRVEFHEWDRLDIEAVRPYREGRNLR